MKRSDQRRKKILQKYENVKQEADNSLKESKKRKKERKEERKKERKKENMAS